MRENYDIIQGYQLFPILTFSMFLLFPGSIIFSSSFLSFANGNTNNAEAITSMYHKLLLATGYCFEKQCRKILGMQCAK